MEGNWLPKKQKNVLTFSRNSTSGQRQPPTKGLEKSKAFFEQLRLAEVGAIQQLALLVLPELRQATKQAGLAKEDVEEILNDAILITLKAIRNGNFQFMDYHPASYTKGVARKLIANRMRSKKTPVELSETMGGESDLTPESYLRAKERQTLVRDLLSQLGENCRKVLILKYFEYLKDEEVITRKLAPYSTTASLKSKRGKCLKKLAGLAKDAGITEAF